MKKIISLTMSFLLLVSLAGCGGGSSAEQNAGSQSGSSSEASSANSGSSDSSAASVSSTSGSGETVPVATVSITDTQMDYIVFGGGEKTYVILPGLSVHSVLGSAEAIAAAYASFTDEYTVYLFDRPADLQEGCSIRDLADATAEAMEALELENADVYGVSQGGMIALYLAIDHPELVHQMILASTLARTNDNFRQVGEKWLQLAQAGEETSLLESFVDAVYSPSTLESYRETLLSANINISEEEYQRFIIQVEACLSFDCYEELSAIQCPVLVLGSEGDKVTTADGARELAEALDCQLYLYDDSYGHAVYDEAPDFLERCLDFLLENGGE